MLDRSQQPQTQQPAEPAAGDGGGGNVDRVLYKNLVEMVPLVESLMVSAVSAQISLAHRRGSASSFL